MSTPSSPPAMSPLHQPPQYRAIGVVLAIGSGLLIGSSFVFKKKGLLKSQEGQVAGEGVAYLKSPMWWFGMILMSTPMGALSVVVSGVLSHFLLKEKLSLFGWISSFQCLIGAAILALNGPEEQSVNTIIEFRKLFVTPWFLSYGGVVIVVSVVLAVWVAPRWGQKSMLPYIGVCSLVGGLCVSCIQGLGACILTSIRGENQFKNWFIYFLLVFVVVTIVVEIYYLNIALAMFNTAMVTPTYYVTFTFCTLVTSVILYKGLKASAVQIMTIVLAFAVICTGIFILQMSKVDPRKLNFVDEHTTLLLEAAKQEADPTAARSADIQRSNTLRSRHSRRSHLSQARRSTISPISATHSPISVPADRVPEFQTRPPLALDIASQHTLELEELDIHEEDELSEKQAIVEKTEEPGLDSVRGVAGALGTIIRARRRARALSAASAARSRSDAESIERPSMQSRESHPTTGGNGPGSARHSGWLRGVWASPKSSRFRSSLEKNIGGADVDLEKGTAEVVETIGSPVESVLSSRRPATADASVPIPQLRCILREGSRCRRP
ncbi:magnesium transporter NIPA-domain-containing protein [Cristinia sonorae]|uniref:Magnesium transporter NIPA-domain-containing protein n=1 Tax=Cristinia sonorae TaxID=1940300 RepID=A0A8K0UMW3_9AGAR|nr:magnesium transporter NIPA-domain-containing protein [Cristinia sonorae]